MNSEIKKYDPSHNYEKLKMYFSPEITEQFAEHEQNDKNFRVAEIVDRTIMQEIGKMKGPLQAAELGGGAHPDRYHKFFNYLLQEPRGKIDWVDISPYMLELAQKKYLADEKYQKRAEVITFIKSDILEYLRGREDEELDLAIMKYTIDHISDLHELFGLFAQKLKRGGKVISIIGSTSPELQSYSTNARFLYNGEPFPDNETRLLHDGDSFTVKFFKVSGDPQGGYIEGAETTKYFHSAEKITSLAQTFGFEYMLGDWKKVVEEKRQEGETMDQEILVLTKK